MTTDDNPFPADPAEPDPQNLEAEQAVLGAMLQSPAAAEKCSRTLTASDFCRPAHRLVFAAIKALAAGGAEADKLTVAARLDADGHLGRAGGHGYLASLAAAPPAVHRAEHYAVIVRDKAVRRRLLDAGRDITGLATGPGDTGGLTERAVRIAEAVRADGQDGDLATPTITEFLDSGSDAYDWLIPGLLERGDRMMLTGIEGFGKAGYVETPVPTPKGWTTLGALSAGDEVFGPDGLPARVIAVTLPMLGRPCYRVRFSDGAEIIADAEHEWVTETLKAREAHRRYARKPDGVRRRGTDQKHKRAHFPAVITTHEIAGSLRARDGHALNHSIEVCRPLQYPPQELPVDPYLLGVWLGDGATFAARLTCADPEIIEQVRAVGQPCRKQPGVEYGWLLNDGIKHPAKPGSLHARLRALGVLGNKHIPELYLRASAGQRLALLQGLMDTDGTVGNDGTGSGRGFGVSLCEFSVTNETLARDVHELLLGLGIKVRPGEGAAVLQGRRVGTRYRLAFQTDLPVFRLPRKAGRLAPLRTRRARLRYITSVEPVPSVAVRCIQVDRADGMFVWGRECIPTHNSTLLDQVAVTAAAGVHLLTGEPGPPCRVLIIDCENSARRKRRNLRPLVLQAEALGFPVAEANLWVEIREGQMDLATDKDVSWLMRLTCSIRPDIVSIGPLKKLSPRAMNDDTEAAPVTSALDMIRDREACVLVEAHAGHGLGHGGWRDMRPRGSSHFLGWPEFGYGLRPSAAMEDGDKSLRIADLVGWRGDREERDWPEQLISGGTWPWSVYNPWTPHAAATRVNGGRRGR